MNDIDGRRQVSRRTAALSLALTLALGAFAPAASAQPGWPSHTVTLIVPFSAGGSTDYVARLLAQKLSEAWHQTVLVDDRPGAGGNIGADMVAKSNPDGTTLLMASGSILTVNPYIYPKMPFDAQKDLVAITNVASGPMLVVVRDGSPFHTLKQLVDEGRAHPGSLHFGSAGIGSQVHMAGEKLVDATGIDAVHVPYRGEAPAYSDLMAGQVQFMVGNIAAASSLVGPGRLRALAVTGRERSKMMPNVPTVAESGYPGFENSGWFGLLAPAGTPKAVVDKIRNDTAQVLAQPEIRAKLATQGMVPVASTPADFARQIQSESRDWAAVVKR
ncbi:MAG: tripartite tricarboxylate transporter substrate binding protein, partial [Burkholderiales bacterium]|nr:tripartite tricarboxylate transporter substrate binding protein [Burkholderiales bacterium]